MGCNRNFSFPHWCTGFLAGASGLRKLARILGRTQGRSALPGNTRISGISWVGKASPCHCRHERKSSDPKTFPLVPAASTSWQGTCFPNSCLTTFLPWVPQHHYSLSSQSSYTSLGFHPYQPVFYCIKHAVPDSSAPLSVICFPFLDQLPAFLCIPGRLSLSWP